MRSSMDRPSGSSLGTTSWSPSRWPGLPCSTREGRPGSHWRGRRRPYRSRRPAARRAKRAGFGRGWTPVGSRRARLMGITGGGCPYKAASRPELQVLSRETCRQQSSSANHRYCRSAEAGESSWLIDLPAKEEPNSLFGEHQSPVRHRFQGRHHPWSRPAAIGGHSAAQESLRQRWPCPVRHP